MVKYGGKVIIRDGSRLDGVCGIVYQVTDSRVMVLLEREVIWPVAAEQVETVKAQGFGGQGDGAGWLSLDLA